jgi:hypothetical protein
MNQSFLSARRLFAFKQVVCWRVNPRSQALPGNACPEALSPQRFGKLLNINGFSMVAHLETPIGSGQSPDDMGSQAEPGNQFSFRNYQSLGLGKPSSALSACSMSSWGSS